MSAESDGPDFESGEDILSVVARGPGSVFLHWQLDGRRSAEVLESGPCEWVIRTINLSEGTSSSTSVDRHTGRCYASVEPGCTYGFELAVRASGAWRTICRTDRVAIPAARPQPPGEASADSSRMRAHVLRGVQHARGDRVPGLSAETTPLRLGSSPHGGRNSDEGT
jgi:hypothetical protein